MKRNGLEYITGLNVPAGVPLPSKLDISEPQMKPYFVT